MKPTVITAAAVPLAALAACSSSPTAPTGAAPASPVATSPTVSAATPTVATPTPTSSPRASRDPNAPGRIGSGQGVTLPTGITVAIPSVVGYPLPKSVGSDSAIMRHGDTEAVLTVVVTNGSKKPVDATLLAITLTASGEQADPVSYSEVPTNNIGGTILPGRSAKGTYGFVVRKSDKGKLQADVWVEQAEPHAVLTERDGTT